MPIYQEDTREKGARARAKGEERKGTPALSIVKVDFGIDDFEVPSSS